MSSAVRRQRWLRILQIGMTIALIGLLLNGVRWSELGALASDASPGLLLLSVALVLLSHLINVARWRSFVQHPSVGYSRLLIWYGAGLFSNNFLPSGIGGDGVRAVLLSRIVPLSQAMVSVGLDRLVGLLALSALLLPGFWLGLPPGLRFGMDQIAMYSALIGLLAVLVAGLAWLARRQLGSLWRSFGSRLAAPGWTRSLPSTSGARLRLLIGGYVFSVGSHLSIAAAYWALLLALRLDVALGASIWLVLVGAVASLLPIAVNGLGVQENAFVVLLACYSVSGTAALAIALLIRMLMLGFSLAGGLLSLAWQPPQFRPTQP